jgi:ATP-dependent Lhr-like helicase
MNNQLSRSKMSNHRLGFNYTIAERWLKSRGWKPFPFQQRVWEAIAHGHSGLLHASTGSGKTHAVWLGALSRWLPGGDAAPIKTSPRGRAASPAAPPLSVLWITPMRALAADTERALNEPLRELHLHWTVGARTADTASGQRAKQSRRLPTVLITTPESLSLLLSRPEARESLSTIRMVIVDEWHELLGNKRGAQLQLAMARLRRWNPELQTWGLSATLGNLHHALEVLVPQGGGRLFQGGLHKDLLIDTLLPLTLERFPWAGHLGMRMLPQVVAELESTQSSLIFTNTRSQSEIWYKALLDARPDWAGLLAIHHGSLDRDLRRWVELGLKSGKLKAVICTSTLDLGVDFLPVERVFQIGSPKGVARLMQRAGRSGHAPGQVSRLTLVPTHSLELIESVAAQDAIVAGAVEPRESPHKPLDVLVQHLVTVALGGGFVPEELLPEIASAYAYRDLTAEEWQWALAFVRHGGTSLNAYPDYRRAMPDENGVWRVPDAQLARRHRMSIGTIVSETSIALRYLGSRGGGKALGSVEEGFIARLKPGDHLLFGGKLLELVRVHEMTAYVRRASGKKPAVPSWNGGRMPLSTELSQAIVMRIAAAADGRFEGPEMELIRPLLELQQSWSALPTPHKILAEVLETREGWHLFVYPYAGRNVHLGLASLLAWRVGRNHPASFSIAVNDYGFELLSASELDWQRHLTREAFTTDHLLEDSLASLNASELAQRRFREIARISGLIFAGYPGVPKSTRQLQASSSLFYDVFRKYDPGNLLLSQAQREVLRQELDLERLAETLSRIGACQLNWQHLKRPTPFAFPLLVERFRESSTSEKLADRITRMVVELEKAAEAGDQRQTGSKSARASLRRGAS